MAEVLIGEVMDEVREELSPAEILAAEDAFEKRARVKLICRVREVRERIGLSLERVAEAIGSSKQWLSSLERGSNARLDMALRLAEFFGATVEELWEREKTRGD